MELRPGAIPHLILRPGPNAARERSAAPDGAPLTGSETEGEREDGPRTESSYKIMSKLHPRDEGESRRDFRIRVAQLVNQEKKAQGVGRGPLSAEATPEVSAASAPKGDRGKAQRGDKNKGGRGKGGKLQPHQPRGPPPKGRGKKGK